MSAPRGTFRTKRWRVVTIAVGVLLVGGLVIYFTPREPSYQGKKLSWWVSKYQQKKRDGGAWDSDPFAQESDEVIRAIGTNAFPIYWKWIRARDNPIQVRINGLLNEQHFIRFRFEDAMNKLKRGYDGVFILGTNAFPGLVEIIHNRSAKVEERRAALDILSQIDGGRGIGMPEYVRLLKCPERVLRIGSAAILWREYPKEAEMAGVYEMFPDWRTGGAKTTATAQSK